MRYDLQPADLITLRCSHLNVLTCHIVKVYNLQGGSAANNRSKRFDLVPATSPGPGAYNINTEWVKDSLCLVPSSAPPRIQQEKYCKGTVSLSVVFICCLLFHLIKNANRATSQPCLGSCRML